MDFRSAPGIFDFRREAQRADGERFACPDLASGDFGKLEGSPAQIGDEPVRVGRAEKHTAGRVTRFLLPGGDPDSQARFGFHLADEFLAVRRLSHGGRGDRDGGIHVEDSAKRLEPSQDQEGPLSSLGAEPSGPVELGAQTAHDLLVEEVVRRPAFGLEHHEPDRVGSDIDDADTRAAGGRRAGLSGRTERVRCGRGGNRDHGRLNSRASTVARRRLLRGRVPRATDIA